MAAVATDEDRADLALMGVTLDDPDHHHDDEGDPDEFPVWDMHYAHVLAFLDLSAHWRLVPVFGGAPVRQGLDYTDADVLLRRRGLGDDAFEDLVVMEGAAIEAFGEIAEDQR